MLVDRGMCHLLLKKSCPVLEETGKLRMRTAQGPLEDLGRSSVGKDSLLVFALSRVESAMPQ